MDSMTEKELDSDGKCFTEQPTRMTRIAHGSGTSIREVEDVLTQHRMMADMAKKMGKNMANMQKQGVGMNGPNKQQQLAAMQRRMQSMGAGASGPGGMNMAEMMKALGGAGGMPGMGGAGGGNPFAGMDMQKMMQQFGGMMGGGMPDLAGMMGGMGGMGGRGGRGGRR